MTPELLRLGQQIAASPEDTEVKKIFADALIEQGDAIRGELIQLELAGTDSFRRRELVSLLDHARQARGLGGLDKGAFPSHWACSADQLAVFGESAFAEEPLLRSITIEIGPREAQSEMRMLAASPALARVRSLTIIGNPSARPGPQGLATLLGSPHWPRLETLLLANCRIGDPGAVRLANAASLSQLTWLAVWSEAVGKTGVIALARSLFLSQVRRLTLWGNLPGPRAIAALAAPDNRMQLERLDLDERQMFAEPLAAIRKRYPGIEIHDKPPEADPEPEHFERGPFV